MAHGAGEQSTDGPHGGEELHARLDASLRHLAFIVGLVLHVFPTFFATKRMSPPVVLGAAALAQVGVVVTIVARLIADGSDAETRVLENAVSNEDAEAKYPDGWESPLPYIRLVKQP